MENEINLSKEQINSLLSSLSGSTQDSEAIKNTLAPAQKEQLKNIMSDPQRIKAILTSPEARRLLQMLKNKRE